MLSASGAPKALAGRHAAGPSPTVSWEYYGGDPGGTHYSPASLISSGNVSSLKLAWRFPIPNMNGSRFESSPIVAGGRLFITGADDTVYALDLASGRLLWRSTAGLTLSSPTNRGVAYGAGMVYVATGDARLIALDAASGRQVWMQQIITVPSGSGLGETMAPMFDRGRVIVGITLGEAAGRGFVASYDARTGKQAWRFYTIPAPKEPGGATWPGGTIFQTAGGAVWMTPVVDPALDLMYVNVGNPVPDYLGRDRAGLNLYTDSIVALHASSGTVAWYFQEVHHDLWDYDPASPPVLLNPRIGGHEVPAIIEAGKTGWLYVLDRRTGRPLVPTPEKPVPPGPAWQHAYPTQPESQNQPFSPQCPDTGLYRREGCIFTPPSDTPTLISPGGIGGASWVPVAYSPRTGLAYICANDRPYLETALASFGHAIATLPTAPVKGQLVGYDVAAGRVAWRQPMAAVCFGGSAATAGDLVFTGESGGQFSARDARTGRLLWHYVAEGGVDAPPSVAVAGGHEYVAVNVGGNAIVDQPIADILEVFTLR
jgi:alcohol dehydrogenase (cytochrome c)